MGQETRGTQPIPATSKPATLTVEIPMEFDQKPSALVFTISNRPGTNDIVIEIRDANGVAQLQATEPETIGLKIKPCGKFTATWRKTRNYLMCRLCIPVDLELTPEAKLFPWVGCRVEEHK